MTAADNTCEHGWTWGQCCPKPWPPCCEPSCTPIPEQKSCFLHGDHDEGAGFIIESLDRLSAAPVDDRERVPEGWRVEWGEWDGDPIAGSGFTPRLVPLPVQGDEQ